MRYNPNVHNRHSIRLRSHDYARTGAYFVTICLNERIVKCKTATNFDFPIFGTVENNVMILNDCGKMVEKYILEIKNNVDKFSNIEIGEYVIMPDHIHTIIEFNRTINHNYLPPVAIELGTVIQWFKTMTTNEYTNNVKKLGWQPFYKKLWQRNYHERIIRNETEYARIAEYIRNNPISWKKK